MKVVTVVGARPQFIKAAVVSPALATAGIDEQIIDTGQHYDPGMSSIFFDQLSIPVPAWSLEIGSGSHGSQTGAMLPAIERVLQTSEPDAVVVYGDTNSTLAGALAAAKLHIPIAHVEAGLRSFNRRMPEEINRVLTDHCSTLLFAPTPLAVANLEREGIGGDSVQLVGDVMFDLVLRVSDAIEQSDIVDRVGVHAGGFVLATIHRAENTDDPRRFESIVNGLIETSRSLPVVWPVHPRTRGLLPDEAVLGDSVFLIDPVGYVEMQKLLRSASVVVTDSGGVQKEAFFNERPCVTLRDETEWVELVELGWNTLVPPEDPMQIAVEIADAVGRVGTSAQPYGVGDAGSRIAQGLGALS